MTHIGLSNELCSPAAGEKAIKSAPSIWIRGWARDASWLVEILIAQVRPGQSNKRGKEPHRRRETRELRLIPQILIVFMSWNWPIPPSGIGSREVADGRN